MKDAFPFAFFAKRGGGLRRFGAGHIEVQEHHLIRSHFLHAVTREVERGSGFAHAALAGFHADGDVFMAVAHGASSRTGILPVVTNFMFL